MNDEGELIRLLTRPHIQVKNGEPAHFDMFEAWLDDELIVVSRQPRLDGARELLRRGHSPDELMTTRAYNRDYDSWIPAPLGELAKWTIVETNRDGLRRCMWVPPQSVPATTTEAPSVRKSPLRGVHVPGGDDDAVPTDAASPAKPTAA